MTLLILGRSFHLLGQFLAGFQNRTRCRWVIVASWVGRQLFYDSTGNVMDASQIAASKVTPVTPAKPVITFCGKNSLFTKWVVSQQGWPIGCSSSISCLLAHQAVRWHGVPGTKMRISAGNSSHELNEQNASKRDRLHTKGGIMNLSTMQYTKSSIIGQSHSRCFLWMRLWLPTSVHIVYVQGGTSFWTIINGMFQSLYSSLDFL